MHASLIKNKVKRSQIGPTFLPEQNFVFLPCYCLMRRIAPQPEGGFFLLLIFNVQHRSFRGGKGN